MEDTVTYGGAAASNIISSHEPLMKIFPSKFSLPSFDSDSLAALAYSRFGNASIDVQVDGFTRLGFIYEESIPCLKTKDKYAHSVEEILDLLRELKFGTDFHLSQKECADSEAFIEFMNSRLRPAVLHTYWLEERNYEELTREAYATLFPLPAAIFYPRWRRMETLNFVFTSEGGDLNFLQTADIELKIYRDAVCCLNYLSDKLGTQAYLFGNTPTTADAIMFGYLAPLLKIPFPKNRLKEHLEGYDNLCNTINHIHKRYFPPTKEELDIKKAEQSEAENIDPEFPHEGRDTFIAVVFGITVMVTYVLLRGVISIHVEDDLD